MRELNHWQNLLFRTGAVLMLAGAAAHIVVPHIALCLFVVGAGAYASMRLRTEYLGRSVTLTRLRRQQLLASACFVLTAILMSMQDLRYGFATRNEWVVSLVVGCVLELYTAWRIPQELTKG
ncbi:MAG TPA: hypothetical protein DDW22_04545 [Prevotellaceae bacterium]|nr:hypothetical protein [Prevotellaceae bacterium]